MAKENEGFPSARDHAEKLRNALVESGAIAPGSDTSALASAVPTWSKGTVALDENTGKPIGTRPESPSFTDGGIVAPSEAASESGVVVPPQATETEPAGRTAQEILAEHNQRLEAAAAATNGHATPGSGREATAPTPAPAGADAGSAAAEAVAQAVVDEWADAETFEFEDPDLDVKIPMRVPKQYAQSAKRGYGKMAAYDRAISYLKNAEPALRPLIESGQLNQLLPLIQTALQDPEFGDFVVKGYQRRQQGLPLIEQARQEAAVAGAAPQYVQQAPGQGPLVDESQLDPFFAEQLRPVLSTVQTLQQQIEADRRARAEADERQRQTVAQQQAESQRINSEVAAAHRDLATMYPNLVRLDLGARDPYLERAINYARDAGYVARYGIAAGIVFGAQQVAALEAERQAATASPAAAALNHAENAQLTDLARQQAAAASRAVGSGAPMQVPPPAPPQRPGTMGADGKRKPADQYLREMQQYLAATGALQHA